MKRVMEWYQVKCHHFLVVSLLNNIFEISLEEFKFILNQLVKFRIRSRSQDRWESFRISMDEMLIVGERKMS
jgi:hypothetical protein